MPTDFNDQRSTLHRRPRSLISKRSKAVIVQEYDEETGEWRRRIKMQHKKFDDEAKGIFLAEYEKWARMGESAAVAGFSTQSVRKAMEEDEEFAEAVLMAENAYRDKLIDHHQDLLFNGTEKITYDRVGNIVSTERVYPIRLIELELKKHDEGYRDKQELKVNHTGGVLVAPAEMKTIDDWENRFKPPVPLGSSPNTSPSSSSSSSSLIEDAEVVEEDWDKEEDP